MTDRTCLACGFEDRDVAMTLVKVEPADQRVVQVAIPVGESKRGVAGFEYADVREQWAAEPRCRDHEACSRRAAFSPERAMEPSPEPPADATQEATPMPDPEPAVPSWWPT